MKKILPGFIRNAVSDAKLTKVSQRPEAIEVGERMLKSMIDDAGLQKDAVILDVGCGYGRIALPLTKYLSKSARYEGFDILPGEIAWATRHVTSQYPNFHFQLANIHNKYYHIEGQLTAREYRFPFDDGTFDFVCLHSVFTHLLRLDLEHYLSEISRVLKPGGMTHITYFLMSSDAGGTQPRRERLRIESDGCWLFDAERPEWETGYEEDYIRTLYQTNQLEIKEPIIFNHQDLVMATKTA